MNKSTSGLFPSASHIFGRGMTDGDAARGCWLLRVAKAHFDVAADSVEAGALNEASVATTGPVMQKFDDCMSYVRAATDATTATDLYEQAVRAIATCASAHGMVSLYQDQRVGASATQDD